MSPSPEIRTTELGAEGATIETLEAATTSDVESDLNEDVLEESDSDEVLIGVVKILGKFWYYSRLFSPHLQTWPPQLVPIPVGLGS